MFPLITVEVFMAELNTPLTLAGRVLSNRFSLAALTNLQSNVDGTLTDDEYNWLVFRAEGGFAMVHTCAAQVSETGKGFDGQLGLYHDRHLDGLTHLADGLRSAGAMSIAQLHHAGMRTPPQFAKGQAVAPSDMEKYQARALTNTEVWNEIECFVSAAERCQRAGFDGVEVHGAHGYLIAQFLSASINRRNDEFGGDLNGRSKMLNEVIKGIRERCGEDFVVGVRLSPERFGVELTEMQQVAQQICRDHRVDYLDMSLWDVRANVSAGEHEGKLLIECFTELDLSGVPLGVAGKIYSTEDAQWCLDRGADFILPGRAAIIHHDFPLRCQDKDFVSRSLPVSREYLTAEKLGPAFIDYMTSWEGFVASA